MPKVELITDLKQAYYRVDIRIRRFFYRPDVASSTAEKMRSFRCVKSKNKATFTKRLLRLLTLLLCKKIFVSEKTQKK